MWFKYLEKKNKLARRLQEKINSYLAKNGKAVRKQAPKAPIDTTRFRIRMYFESTCPHCKKMMNSLKTLQQEGYFVEALQIDNKPHKGFPIVTSKAHPLDVKKFKIRSVPFTLIADLKSKTISQPLTGFQSAQSLKDALITMQKRNN